MTSVKGSLRPQGSLLGIIDLYVLIHKKMLKQISSPQFTI